MAKNKSRARKKIRVAFIGAGSRALMAYYPSLRDIPEAELVAIAELDEQRLHKTCDLYGIKGRYSDYRQMLERAKPDAVSWLADGCSASKSTPPASPSSATPKKAVSSTPTTIPRLSTS